MIFVLAIALAFMIGVLSCYGIRCEERNQMREENARLNEQVNRLRGRWPLYDPVNCRCSLKVEEDAE